MDFCIIKILTQTATFRNPDFQNFHKTLFLPPPTTIIGFAGAALGLSPQEAQKYFLEDYFQFGVYGTSDGIAKDLWKYRKKKSSHFEIDILTKEILYSNKFFIVFASNNISKISQLRDAFENPYYALTMGNSDSLAKIKLVDNHKFSHNKTIQNTIVEGDVISKVINNSNKTLEFSIYTTSEPITYDLPIQYYYKERYGARRISKRKQFSFIGKQMTLNYFLEGVIVSDFFIPLFSIN